MSRKITLERRGVRFARRNRGMGHGRHRFGFSVVRSRSPLLALDERRIPVLPDHWRAKRSSPSKAFQLLTSKRGDHLIGLDLTR